MCNCTTACGCNDNITDLPKGSKGDKGDAGNNGNYTTETVEAPGVNCTYGGVKIEIHDGITDAIIDTQYVCNGAPGSTGATGATGPAGSNGSNGTNGTNGTNGCDPNISMSAVLQTSTTPSEIALTVGRSEFPSNDCVPGFEIIFPPEVFDTIATEVTSTVTTAVSADLDPVWTEWVNGTTPLQASDVNWYAVGSTTPTPGAITLSLGAFGPVAYRWRKIGNTCYVKIWISVATLQVINNYYDALSAVVFEGTFDLRIPLPPGITANRANYPGPTWIDEYAAQYQPAIVFTNGAISYDSSAEESLFGINTASRGQYITKTFRIAIRRNVTNYYTNAFVIAGQLMFECQ